MYGTWGTSDTFSLILSMFICMYVDLLWRRGVAINGDIKKVTFRCNK